MKKIRVAISMGYVGCQVEEVIEVEDDATEDEIQELALDILHEKVELNYFEVAEDGD